MTAHVEGFCGPLGVGQFKGGQSNPTYKLTTPGRSYVLRRKPPGKLLPSAHAVDREYRVMAATGAAGFPAPRVYALCEDDAVIGTAFYVMECVEGRIFWNPAFPETPFAERYAYFDAMNATLAALHWLDYAAIGLSGYGRTGGYFARQIARWSRQYREDEAAGRVEALDRLIDWLPDNIPPGDETTIVHGDFRCDNMIYHPTRPKVIAVLDWELSTLGHPLADFAFSAMIYRMPPGGFFGLDGQDPVALGLPSEADYIAAYCGRTGRAGIENYDFYVAFNMFRLSAILHGIRGRIVRGTASSANAEDRAAQVEPIAEKAWEQALRAMRD